MYATVATQAPEAARGRPPMRLTDLGPDALVEVLQRCPDAQTAAAAAGSCRWLRIAEAAAGPVLYCRLAVEQFGRALGAQVAGKQDLAALCHPERVEWRRLDGLAAPPPRNGTALASFDDLDGHHVLFGGSGSRRSRHSEELLDDLWECCGDGSWSLATVTPGIQPPARWGHTLTAVDSHTAVLFGGFGGDDTSAGIHSDTWLLRRVALTGDDGVPATRCGSQYSWEQLQTSAARQDHRPRERAFHTATLVGGRWLVLAGGLGHSRSHEDAEVLDTVTWQYLPLGLLAIGPVCPTGGCAGHLAAWLGDRGMLVLAAGCGRGCSCNAADTCECEDVYRETTVVRRAVVSAAGAVPPTFEEVCTLPLPASCQARCPVYHRVGRTVLCWGGNLGPNAGWSQFFSRKVYALNTAPVDPRVWAWQELPAPPSTPQPAGREAAVCYEAAGCLRMLGGADFSERSELADIWELRLCCR